MRNRFPGVCYQCGKEVAPFEGHFERRRGQWVVHHVSCCLIRREGMNPDKALNIQKNPRRRKQR